jgi:hypothetical protein
MQVLQQAQLLMAHDLKNVTLKTVWQRVLKTTYCSRHYHTIPNQIPENHGLTYIASLKQNKHTILLGFENA